MTASTIPTLDNLAPIPTGVTAHDVVQLLQRHVGINEYIARTSHLDVAAIARAEVNALRYALAAISDHAGMVARTTGSSLERFTANQLAHAANPNRDDD